MDIFLYSRAARLRRRLGKWRTWGWCHMPFFPLWLYWTEVRKLSGSVLDIGCGDGTVMAFCNRHGKFCVIGADIFLPSLRKALEICCYQDMIQCDVRYLPFKVKSFDAVVILEVIEHLKRNQGEIVLRQLENIARNYVVLATPVGTYKQSSWQGNPFQEHKSVWNVTQLRALGYQVHGVGVKGFGGEGGVYSRFPVFLGPLLDLIWMLWGPIAYFFPTVACRMIATKRVKC